MITYRATLDVPDTTVATVSAWLRAHRRRHDTRPWQRAASCWRQAVLVLRWLVDGTDVDHLARDTGVSQAGYRYLQRGDRAGVTDRAPELSDVLGAREAGRVGVRRPGRHPGSRPPRCRPAPKRATTCGTPART